MNLHRLFSAAVAVLVFALIALSAAATEPWQQDGANGEEDMDALVQALFTDHVIALEVLGILLTAALIGALVIARPLGAVPDEHHYRPADTSSPTPPAEQTASPSTAAAATLADTEEE